MGLLFRKMILFELAETLDILLAFYCVVTREVGKKEVKEGSVKRFSLAILC